MQQGLYNQIARPKQVITLASLFLYGGEHTLPLNRAKILAQGSNAGGRGYGLVVLPQTTEF